MNILVIGDTHIPFEHENYLEFCLDTKKKYRCGKVVHIGDLVDNHSISQHEHSPEGFSPFEEHRKALNKLVHWYKSFPEVTLLQGNHDERIEREAYACGISNVYLKPFKEVWELPRRWEHRFDCYIHGVRFFHGMGYNGEHAHNNAMKESSTSIVMGHLHSNGGVAWLVNETQRKFGLAVGCGIDRNTYAFNYGRDHRRKPIIGCGVVLDNGKDAMFVPMNL